MIVPQTGWLSESVPRVKANEKSPEESIQTKGIFEPE